MKNVHGLAVSTFVVLLSIGCAKPPTASLERPTYSINCNDLDNYASKSGDDAYVVSFLNTKDSMLKMYWINYKGEEVLKGEIAPGDTWSQNTFVTHPWVARDTSGACVAAFDSTKSILIEIR